MKGFRKLLDNKSIVDLKSTLPPMTGSSWPSIYTGLTPEEHGIPDFFVMKKDYTPDLVFYDSEKVPPFWKTLSQSGLRCLVITPATDIKLPTYANTDMITGFPLKAKANSAYLNSLMKKHDFYGEPDIEKHMKSGKMTEKEGLRHFVASISKRVKIAKEAMEKQDYAFVYVCFTETDRLQHFIMNKKDRNSYLLPIYSEMDKLLVYILKKIEKEGGAVALVSDHGAQPVEEKFLINSWLMHNGYAKIRDSVISEMAQKTGKSPLQYNLREKLLKTRLRKIYDVSPHFIKKAIAKSAGTLLSSGKPGEYTRLHLFDFDMKNTRVFAGISNLNVATLWINDKRFANGIVKEGEKPRIKKELSRKLMEVRNKKGQKVIANTYDGQEYYGKTDKFIPADLFVDAKEGYSIDIFNFSQTRLFMEPEPPKRGDHTHLGIFGLYPQSSLIPKNPSVLDVKSVILKYYNINKQKIR